MMNAQTLAPTQPRRGLFARLRRSADATLRRALRDRVWLRGVSAGGILAMAVLLGGGSAGAVDLSRQAVPLFGAASVPSSDLSPFFKWTTVLAAFRAEEAQMHQPCQAGDSCKLQQWSVFIDSLRDKDPWTQIATVNERMNSARYIEDNVNYGQSDYWATPGQFFERSGDCEDYAIAKFMTLRELGFPNEQMRIAIVQDTNLNLIHAVLVVYYQDVAYLLDNQIQQVVRVDSIRHYRPYYSLNETLWWRHS
ncbi:MAG: transglutaminase-like cysteine peptidase [Alphaproteobacteria bacterium]